LIAIITYYSISHYLLNKKEKLSKNLYENFEIKTLYASQNDSYTTNLDTSNYVIGIIEITSIGISYPIISEATDENLKIAPCKFWGSMPNEVGNLCIVAHNYNNYKFFSKIKNLNIGNVISIYDLKR
jgi:sortase (surface protein transpeptidase)